MTKKRQRKPKPQRNGDHKAVAEGSPNRVFPLFTRILPMILKMLPTHDQLTCYYLNKVVLDTISETIPFCAVNLYDRPPVEVDKLVSLLEANRTAVKRVVPRNLFMMSGSIRGLPSKDGARPSRVRRLVQPCTTKPARPERRATWSSQALRKLSGGRLGGTSMVSELNHQQTEKQAHKASFGSSSVNSASSSSINSTKSDKRKSLLRRSRKPTHKIIPTKVIGLCVSVSEKRNECTLDDLLDNIDRMFLYKLRIVRGIPSTGLGFLHGCSNLRDLDLSYSGKLEDVSFLSNCPMVQRLNLSGCDQLRSIAGVESLPRLGVLDVSGCESLESIDELARCTQLWKLDVSFCDDIRSFQALYDLPWLRVFAIQAIEDVRIVGRLGALEHLNMAYCDEVMHLNTLADTSALRTISLAFCEELRSITALTNHKGLVSLNASHCGCFKDCGPLAQLPLLATVNLSYTGVSDLSALSHCRRLESLNISNCEKVCTLKMLGSNGPLGCLRELDVSGCELLDTLDGLNEFASELRVLKASFGVFSSLKPVGAMKNLEVLNVSSCDNVGDIRPLRRCVRLRELDLSCCEQLSSVEPLRQCTELEKVALAGCVVLKDVWPVSSLPQLRVLDLSECLGLGSVLELCTTSGTLEELDLSYCEQLTDVDVLGELPALRKLKLDQCVQVQDLNALGLCKELEWLSLVGCTGLRDVVFVRNCPRLELPNMEGCPPHLQASLNRTLQVVGLM